MSADDAAKSSRFAPSVRGLKAWPALEQKEIDRFQSKLVHRVRSADVKIKRRRLTDVFLVAGSRAVFPGLGSED
jgi:hypothetical protein